MKAVPDGTRLPMLPPSLVQGQTVVTVPVVNSGGEMRWKPRLLVDRCVAIYNNEK